VALVLQAGLGQPVTETLLAALLRCCVRARMNGSVRAGTALNLPQPVAGSTGTQ
jgi:hypothetical protein